LVPRVATQYLNALSRSDVRTAYSILSKEARARCSIEEFQAWRSQNPWTWSDLRLVQAESEAAVVKALIKVPGKTPSDEYLIFQREDGKWTRPFNWTLLRQAEDALSRNDPDMALLTSQAAARVNPRDALARGYLCEAFYYRKASAEILRECALAVKLARSYPSNLPASTLYRLRVILGDTYKNSMRQYPEALNEYDAALSFPGLSQTQKCELLLARADTLFALKRSPEAETDLRRAAGNCSRRSDLDYIRLKQAGREGGAPNQ
jgi:tetratricopeptide (TPR) repeat protein